MYLFLNTLTLTNDIFMVTDREGMIIHVGGLDAAHWKKGDRFESILPPELAKNIRYVLSKENSLTSSHKILYNTPSIERNTNRWIKTTWFHTSEEHGSLIVYLFQDVTRDKEVEQENLKLNKAIEQSAHSVLITNLNGEIEYVNQHFIQNSGYDVTEIKGKRPGDIVKSGIHSPEFYKEMWEQIKTHDSWAGEFCNRKKTGELYWEQATIAAVRDESGKVTHYIAIQSDITEQKKSLWDLEKSKNYSEKLNRILGFALEDAKKARLESENANKAKSEFLANMSHEIRTPMNSLVGMIDLFRETPLNESQKKYLEIMDRSSQMLLNLINDVLDLSRIEAGFIELESTFFNLEDVIDTIVDIMSTKAHQKGIDLFLDIKTPMSFIIQSDPIRMRQVLLNLTSNAVKFTDQGAVTLTVYTEEQEKDRFLVIQTKDTGIGIAKEKIGLLFQKFSQLSSTPEKLYGGSGLGLVITKKIVEKLEGTITVESELGKGSVFTVKLPLKEYRQKTISNNRELQISLGNFSSTNREIISSKIKEMMPNARIIDNKNCTFCHTAKHCNDNKFCDFFIVESGPLKHIEEEVRPILLDKEHTSTQVILCLTHEQRRIILQEFHEIAKHIHLIDKPIKRKELFSYLTGEKTECPEAKKFSSEDMIRQQLKVPLRILLVDDSEDNRVLMMSFMQKIPVTIEIAENGAEALELSKQGDYDITFMDMQMPIMDGYHAMRELRSFEKEHKKNRRYIVALSAFAFADEIEHSYQAGCDYYLTKPIKKPKLMEVILLYIKSREILS